MQTTQLSLLQRVQSSADQAAWARFVQLYTPLVSHWVRGFHLQPDDAADLAQEIFAVCITKISSYQKRPETNFRAWLWTLTLNKFRERRRREAARPTAGDAWLEDVTDDVATNNVDEVEYRTYLVNRAMRLMQAEFEPRTWQACWEFVANAKPAAEVAESLGITLNAVYLAKSRVLRRLREELAGFLDE